MTKLLDKFLCFIRSRPESLYVNTFYLPIFIGMVWMGLRTITYAHRVLKSDDQGK